MSVMMKFTNNASSRLYASIDAITTTIRVQSGDGVKFPTVVPPDEYYTVTIEDRRSNQIEICKGIGKSGDILNVIRGQEGTVAQAFSMGATVSNRLTAGTMDFLAHAGAQGPQGEVGPVGPQGATGPAGPPGPQGEKGETGLTGPQGTTGPQGVAGPVGPPGPQGIQGQTGQTGPTGPAGPKGDTGADSTVPGPTGPTGPAGPAGPQGPKGDTGATGATGSQGSVGPQGPKGDTGATGATGSQGPVGPQGDVGPQGATGAQGPKGDTGVQGPVGPQGAIGPTGGQIMYIGDGPPASPVIGQTWWESDTGNSFIYYDDGNSVQWVPTHVGALPTGEGGGGGIPEAPVDGKTYGRKDAAWAEVTGGGGSGNVVGPASAMDNAVARFDTTTGKLLQNSSLIVQDDGKFDFQNAGQTIIGRTTEAASAGTFVIRADPPHGQQILISPRSDVIGSPCFTGGGMYTFDNKIQIGSTSVATTVGLERGGSAGKYALKVDTGLLNLPHGAAPGTPVNGDIWTQTEGMYACINGATVGPLGTGGGGGSSDWADITNKPSTFPPSTHTHLWADITDKPTTFTPATHSHPISEVTNLQTTLDGKVNGTTRITVGTSAPGSPAVGDVWIDTT